MSRYKTPKRPPPEIGLFMECEDEELSPSQKTFYGKIKKDHQKFTKKMDEYISKMKGELIVDEGDCFLFQIKHGLAPPAPPKIVPVVDKPVLATVSKGVRFSSAPVAPAVKTPPPTRGRRAKQPAPPPQPTPTSISALRKSAPAEASALGGIFAGTKNPTRIFNYASGDADSEEVLMPKLVGKFFPSLTVAVKPQLAANSTLILQSSTERANLDVQVKGVLMYSAGKFTEWLIQQGLIRSEQSCEIHHTARKLGMYNDISKFPFSGGYVWISDCCPSDFMSVYYGSILEKSCYIPNVILKLIYHWACQTNVSNVVQWVKVPPIHVKEIFSLLRAACTLALNEKYGLLGGRGKRVQVAFLSLGSGLSSSSNPRIDVMGAMDVESSRIRLLAVDNEKKRRPEVAASYLATLVDSRSTICVGNLGWTRSSLETAGFIHITQGIDEAKAVVDYMKKAVPRMFQHSVQFLSKVIIQQFLDELVWRERWGPIAAYAFNNMTKHLADFTLHSKEERILERLKKTAENPFRFMPTVAAIPSVVHPATIEVRKETAPVKGQKRAADLDSPLPPAKKPQVTAAAASPAESYWKTQPLDTGVTAEIANFICSNSSVSIESYYYGNLRGDENKIVDRKPADQIAVKCSVCLRQFSDNLMLLKHLLLHCQTKPVNPGPIRKAQQCQQCFVGFPNAVGLRCHEADVHNPPQAMKDRMCLICEKLFVDKVQLVYHMHRVHVQLELPYVCQICGYRTSLYSSILEHFVVAHRSGRHLLCPYCLLTVGVTRNEEAISSNVVFFMSHIQRHQRDDVFNCYRCRLSFISAGNLERHLEKEHCSLRLNENVTPFKMVCKTMMPTPGALIKTALLPSFKEKTRKPGQYSIREFPTPIVPLVPASATCAECEESMASPNHFSGVMKCSKCPYQSCCESAVAEHFSLYHDKNSPTVSNSGQAISTLYCACGFFSSSANTLAKHLVQCGKMVAYCSEATAREAQGFYEKEEDTEHTVLNVLGLMRNPAEPVVVKSQEPSPQPITLSEPHIRISQPKVVLSKLESIDSMQKMDATTTDEDSEATITAPSSQEDASSTAATATDTDPMPDEPLPQGIIVKMAIDGSNSASEQEPSEESQPTDEPAVDSSEPVDLPGEANIPNVKDVRESVSAQNTEDEEMRDVSRDVDSSNSGEAIDESEKERSKDEIEQPTEFERSCDAKHEDVTPTCEQVLSAATEIMSENVGEPSVVAKTGDDGKVDNKEESAGRWIEELENMMDTDEITPSVVSEAPDFVTDFMNSESA